MMTRFARGRGPTMARSSSADLTLCRYRSSNPTSISGALLAEVVEPGLGRFRNPIRVPQGGVAPALNVDQHSAHAVLETHRRFPPEPGRDLGNIREGAVGLARTFVHIDQAAAEKLDQPVDRLRIA